MEKHLIINGKKVSFDNEKNLLEVIRKKNIELPTFCYHSELSIHGSCRLCMVEIEGKGIFSACSTLIESGMKVNTNTEQVMNIRKIIIELLLANHDRECTICEKSESCKLQTLARRIGVNEIRFKNLMHKKFKDVSTYSLVIDQGKCVLCVDCVRFCDEIQTIGALGFANRGTKSIVCPSFGKDLESSECVYCGQCARVCPTGAIIPKSEVSYVWKALNNPNKKVIIAIAPAVRAAIGEVLGFVSKNGIKIAGKIVTALRSMGFAKIFDISFAADMTIVEEANEFTERLKTNKNIPMFTSCCPAWVKFVEQYYPDFIQNLSTCRSPQGMYGSIARKIMPEILEISRKDLVVVSVMPCTAKKYEARRVDGVTDIDYVLTTQELARMIEEFGFCFNKIEESEFDMPLGFKTGGGIIFGNSGGVSEAVLRNLVNNKLEINEAEQFSFVRGENAIRELKMNFNGRELKMVIAYGLGNARKILRDIKIDREKYDFVEIMACPNGCIGGAGQPMYTDLSVRKNRARILYENDKTMDLHKSCDNLYVRKIYEQHLGKPGSEKACEYLHTKYEYRKRFSEILEISRPTNKNNIKVNICFGNNCIKKGAKEILKHVIDFTEKGKYKNNVGIEVSICLKKCSKGPIVKIANNTLRNCTPDIVERVMLEELDRI